jgi:hypothetical protein
MWDVPMFPNLNQIIRKHGGQLTVDSHRLERVTKNMDFLICGSFIKWEKVCFPDFFSKPLGRLGRLEDIQTAHIGPQSFGNNDGPVGLLVIFQDGKPSAAHG